MLLNSLLLSAWTIGLAFFLTMAILIALMIKRKDHPANLILLSAFVSMKKMNDYY